MPAVQVSAFSGARLTFPPLVALMNGEGAGVPARGSLTVEKARPDVANSSDRFGARMSREAVARRRTLSLIW